MPSAGSGSQCLQQCGLLRCPAGGLCVRKASAAGKAGQWLVLPEFLLQQGTLCKALLAVYAQAKLPQDRKWIALLQQ